MLAALRGRVVAPRQWFGFRHRGEAYRAVVVAMHDVHGEEVGGC
jgi:hypothetical protein